LKVLGEAIKYEMVGKPVYDRLGELNDLQLLARLPLLDLMKFVKAAIPGEAGGKITAGGAAGELSPIPLSKEGLTQLGFDNAQLLTFLAALKPWYTGSNSSEGVGEGWYYSLLGGGKDFRPTSSNRRTNLDVDNTAHLDDRGDAAVPTLFNGNFDAGDWTFIETLPLEWRLVEDTGVEAKVRNAATGLDEVVPAASILVPGWTYHGGRTGLFQMTKLADITSLSETYRSNFGDRAKTNFSAKLTTGQSITHNRSLIPANAEAVRFDLHVPSEALATNGKFKVYLNSSVAGYSKVLLGEVLLSDVLPTNTQGKFSKISSAGTQQFERFKLKLPDAVRGSVGTLTFELEGGSVVYLDNAFLEMDWITSLTVKSDEVGDPISSVAAAESFNPIVNDLTPILSWNFDSNVIKNPADQVTEVTLTISTFDAANGLLANTDWEPNETNVPNWIVKPSADRSDYNPNRILTATWKREHVSFFRRKISLV
jgi:hypothetical protein